MPDCIECGDEAESRCETCNSPLCDDCWHDLRGICEGCFDLEIEGSNE